MLKVLVDYPAHDEELTVVARSLEPPVELEPVLSLERAEGAPGEGRRGLRRPGADLLGRRPRDRDAQAGRARRSPAMAPYVSYGASPRGPITSIAAARALALIRGRDYVLAADIEALVRDAFRHRLVLSYQALAEEVTADQVLDEVLESVAHAADRPRPAAPAAA